MRIAFVAMAVLVRLLVPTGFMPAAQAAEGEWAGFVICYGAGDASLPIDDRPIRSAHEDCLFATAHNIAVAYPPAAHRLPTPDPSGAVTLPADRLGFCCKPRAYRNGARAPPAANDEIQIHIV